jgi:hypothetical protein
VRKRASTRFRGVERGSFRWSLSHQDILPSLTTKECVYLALFCTVAVPSLLCNPHKVTTQFSQRLNNFSTHLCSKMATFSLFFS